MMDLEKLNPNEYPGTPGNLLATLLEISMLNKATLRVLLENQAVIASKQDPLIDKEKFLQQSQEDIDVYFNEIKALIYSKAI